MEEHFEDLQILTDEKGSQFMNIPLITTLTEKMENVTEEFQEIIQSIRGKDNFRIEKLQEYKQQIFTITKNEKVEFEQNYYLIYQFKKYLSILQEIKEASNKRLKKMIKTATKKNELYNYNLPLVDIWEIIVWKFTKMVKNNTLYINFIKESKVKIEGIFKTYFNSTRAAYKKI